MAIHVWSLHLDPPFLLLALASAPFPLPQLHEVCGKPAQLLQRECGTPLTSFSSPQVMSPRPMTSTRPQSSPTCSSWTRRRSSPTKSLVRTPTTMTLNSKTCSIKYIESKPITLYEKTCLSVCGRRQRPIEQGRPVGDRSGRPSEHRSSEAQTRTLLDHQKEQILAELPSKSSVHTNFKQLEPKKSNDSFKDNFCSKSWNFVKLIKEVSLKWKN